MADRYWVGGSGTWNSTSTANWSASSGGSSGASVPTAADNVFFDQNSTYTVTIDGATLACLDITVSNGTVTFVTGTVAGITISGNMSVVAATVWNMVGGLTFNATTSKTITTNGVVFSSNFTFDGVGGSWALQDNLSLTSLRAVTLTSGTLDLNNKTISAGFFFSSNSNTRTLAFGSTGILQLTGNATTILNFNTATNLTFTGTLYITSTYTGATGTRIFSTNGLTEAQAFSVATSGSSGLILGTTATDTIALTGSYKDVDLTGFTNTLSNTGRTIYGNLTVPASGGTFTAGAQSTTFAATSGTKTITTNGRIVDFPVIFNGAGGTWRLEDALTIGSSRTLNLTNGTLNLNGKTLTIGSFNTSAGTKNITFNGGTIVVNSNFTNASPTGFTTTAGTGTGKISLISSTAKTFALNGCTFNCTISNDGAGQLNINQTTGDNGTINNLTNGVQPTALRFTSAKTYIINNWNVRGTAGNLVTIDSSTTSAHTLSKSSGTVSADYLSISYSTATGGATWYAGANSTDGGNNTGWIFTAAPASTGNFLSFFT